jgi:hypothetical protein
MRSIYNNFLTDIEIKSMLENKDIWMEPEEVFKRLNKKEEMMNVEAKPKRKPVAKKAAAKTVRKKPNARKPKE